MFVIICLTEPVNKLIAKSNIRRMVNQIKHRHAVITYPNRTVMSSYQTHTLTAGSGLVGSSFSVPIGPVYRHNMTAIFSFPDIRVMCQYYHVSVLCASKPCISIIMCQYAICLYYHVSICHVSVLLYASIILCQYYHMPVLSCVSTSRVSMSWSVLSCVSMSCFSMSCQYYHVSVCHVSVLSCHYYHVSMSCVSMSCVSMSRVSTSCVSMSRVGIIICQYYHVSVCHVSVLPCVSMQCVSKSCVSITMCQ